MATRMLLSISLLLSSLSGSLSTTFTLTNSCGYTVWPGLLSSAGSPPLSTTGFALAPGESRAVDAPAAWSGRIWGRTLCAQDASGKFSCATGECGSGAVECAGGGAAPPTTLAEFTLNGAGGSDFYDVSLVDGSNLPLVVTPQGGSGGGTCAATGCLVDVNGACPADLRVAGADGAVIACKSACGAYGRPEDCCSGDHNTPQTCQPSPSSQYFKSACPRAYSYAYDDATSTFTCTSGTASYLITFCPSVSSLKSSVSSVNPSSASGSSAGQPLVNETVSFAGQGGNPYEYGSASATPAPSTLVALAAAALTLLCTARRLPA